MKPKRIPIKRKRLSQRKEAFARLSEIFANRSCAEGDETDLTLAMQGEPEITSSLKMAHGGLRTVLEALRAFEDEDAQAFIELHDSLSKRDRMELSLEEIAVAADIGASRLLGVATEALKAYGQSVSQIILGASLPHIVRKSVKLALTTKGISDREMMLKAGAVLPIPKGSQIAIQQVNQLPEPQESKGELPPWDQEAQLRKIREAQGEIKQLPQVSHTQQPIPPSVDSIQQMAAEVLAQD